VTAGLLGPAEVRALVAELGIRPTRALGQNFLHDPNTIRRIVRTAGLGPADVALEVGPGLGSLTLGLLGTAGHVTAVEVDPALAAALPATVADRRPDRAGALTVVADSTGCRAAFAIQTARSRSSSVNACHSGSSAHRSARVCSSASSA